MLINIQYAGSICFSAKYYISSTKIIEIEQPIFESVTFKLVCWLIKYNHEKTSREQRLVGLCKEDAIAINLDLSFPSTDGHHVRIISCKCEGKDIITCKTSWMNLMQMWMAHRMSHKYCAILLIIVIIKIRPSMPDWHSITDRYANVFTTVLAGSHGTTARNVSKHILEIRQ